MPLTSLVAVLVRYTAVTLVLQLCQLPYYLYKADLSLSLGHSSALGFILFVLLYLLLQVLVPLALWYKAGWIAKSLVGSYECALTLGIVSRNDLYQLGIIYLGATCLINSLPELFEQLQYAQTTFDGSFHYLNYLKDISLCYIISKILLGLYVICANKTLIRLVPPAD